MTQQAIPELSKAEYDVMSVLWKHGQLSVRETHNALCHTTQWAYTTTKTVMDRMVKKALLKRESFHGIYIYKPLISRPLGLAKLVHFFAKRVLETDYATVVSMFAQNKTISQDELDELSKILESDQMDK